jgi:hypothetical protein
MITTILWFVERTAPLNPGTLKLLLQLAMVLEQPMHCPPEFFWSSRQLSVMTRM